VLIYGIWLLFYLQSKLFQPMSQNFSNDFSVRQAMRPTTRTWVKHSLWLLVTFITTTIAGAVGPFGLIALEDKILDPNSEGYLDLISKLIAAYPSVLADIFRQLFSDSVFLTDGLSFSLSILFILGCHEAGHYIACRIYGVDATLPYFIPTPPLISPAGTFGAVIKILSPMPSRKSVFDIGVAGPIAGFIALIPIAFLGMITAKMHRIDFSEIPTGKIIFSDPLLLRIFAAVNGIDLSIMQPNPFYFAAWLGLLVTAMNLFPSGQLDGGHAVFAVFGETIHKWTGRLAFVLMLTLSTIGWFYYGSPSGILFTVILAIMMFVKHPMPFDQRPIDLKRKIIALITLFIFILSFVPFAIQITP
jgi:membrane-associated protease RseP (regulator of RpoE activity)